jgi:hypothetical protein
MCGKLPFKNCMHGVRYANRSATINGGTRVLLCGQLRKWRCRTRSLPGKAVEDYQAGKHRAAMGPRELTNTLPRLESQELAAHNTPRCEGGSGLHHY